MYIINHNVIKDEEKVEDLISSGIMYLETYG